MSRNPKSKIQNPKSKITIVLALFWILCLSPVSAQTTLHNPSFDADTVLEGWSTNVYGAAPTIAADTQIVHQGRQSLRVSADAPSDTAFGQEIRIAPSRLYRLRGWVRTHQLDPHGAPVYGTFQIQRPNGSGVIASGENHGGETDWTPVSIVFQAPPDGRTRIVAFFVGFDKGTGTAWFDDLTLEEVNPAMSSIKVTRDALCPGAISPLQYGQFIEYLCTLVPGMWAEKLSDGSFEGSLPYKLVYLKETDFKEKPWYPSGATNRATFTLDHETKVSGDVSKKIATTGDTPCTMGISQDGIAVQHGTPCAFSIYLKQTGIAGPVHVRLHAEGRELASASFQATGEWTKYHATLSPAETENNATLTIEFRGPGTLWIDNASLMPADNVGGWRRDVVEAVRALKPGIIRFGGSALDDANLGEFDWRSTIGDPDHRTPFRAWGGVQPAGAGLEEIVQFCHAVDAEPLICVRVNRRKPQDAAEEVHYFNGDANTPMGALRARNGHPEPYRIRYWQVGNELAGSEYDARLADFCRAMRAADPTIRLLSSFPTEGVLRSAGDLLDYVCPHQYDCADLSGEENELVATRRLIHDHAPGRDIKVGVTEWNTTAGDAGPNRAMLWTLSNALACSRYHNLLHRQADLVEIANRSNLTNSFCSGIIQTDSHRLYKTPTYYAQQLYSTLAGTRPLKIESEIPPNTAPDISATLSAKGDSVILFAINDSLQEVTRTLDLSAFGNAGQEATVWILTDRRHAGEPDVTNSFNDPERVTPVHTLFHAKAARFDYKFPPLSLTVIVWHVTKGP